MAPINVHELRELTNADDEFRLSARLWNGRVKVLFGDDAYVLVLHDGQIEEVVDAPDEYQPYDILITGGDEDWEKLLAQVPEPFYQDLYSASVHHGMSFGGDLEQFFAYHAAIRRMTQIMRRMRTAA
jgi:hypothetical protein